MITEKEYRNIMTDVYRKVITAVNIETGDDGSKGHEVLKVFHELLRMDEKQYRKQQKFYGQKNFQPSDLYKSLALVRSERLQATSVKLQAASGKLDKKTL